ncbi:hypothetical protein B0J12DRAFT_53457 [Macrophomina phaseolina]|uniref:Uncharacterized protein n=1 Tax=Macrophomina phaseolina TaxID=35725 RepID=A0ABQ8GEH5_9PEZI|nr:hypothetical protein B0J12DRAFT_53457 [Macrophomina phaseolina]
MLHAAGSIIRADLFVTGAPNIVGCFTEPREGNYGCPCPVAFSAYYKFQRNPSAAPRHRQRSLSHRSSHLMDDLDDIVIIDWHSVPRSPSVHLTSSCSSSDSMLPVRSRPLTEPAEQNDRPLSSACETQLGVYSGEPEHALKCEVIAVRNVLGDCRKPEKMTLVDGKDGSESSIDATEEPTAQASIVEEQEVAVESSSMSGQPSPKRPNSPSTSEDEVGPATPQLLEPTCGPPHPPPPPLPPLVFENPPPPPPPLLYNYGSHSIRGACPPYPPPLPPPPMPYQGSLSPTGAPPPPPPPPPPIAMAGPPLPRKRRAGLVDLEVVDSAMQLRPCLLPRTISDTNNTTLTQPLERVVRLPVGGPTRRAALTHHASTPFDLHTHLWLLRYGEPDRWYARPSDAELRRHRALEAAGLAHEIAGLLSANSGAAVRPTPADVVRVAVGEVMGVPTSPSSSPLQYPQQQPPRCWCVPLGEGPADAQCPDGPRACEVRNRRAVADAFLTFYMVLEAPRARAVPSAVDEGLGTGAYGPYAPPPPLPSVGRMGLAGGRGEEKVYMLEKVGSREACLARAYHNAALNGWSTVFCCVVRGDVEIGQATKPGIEGLERVRGLGALVAAMECEEGKVEVFY